MRQTLNFVDPSQLLNISNLELLSRGVVEGIMVGRHRSPHSGSSIEFAQYRPYTQGEDLRALDWKLYGRTDRLHVKQFQAETNLRCTILLDCSASMDYGSAGIQKFDYARMLAACLAMVLKAQNDSAGFIAYHKEVISYTPPRASAETFNRILVELTNLKPAGTSDPESTLQFLGDVIKPRGMVVLISDLLHPLDSLIPHLRSLRARRHDLLILQIADPYERDFPFDRTATFVDAESSEERFTVPDEARDMYLENRRKHFDAIRSECLAAEIELEEFPTNEPLDRALRFFLQRRNHALLTSSGGGHRRRGGAG